MTEFFEKSKLIADDYIQSIVFLDDKAYQEESSEEFKQHDFNAYEVTKIFASQSKICAVYRPSESSDIDNFKVIANKADVVILDWQINFNKSVAGENLEVDDDDEPRGVYTIPIIKDILFEDELLKNNLKLIVIYTGDYTILEAITEKIFEDLSLHNHGFRLNKEDCTIESNNFKISIRAKEIEFNTETIREKYESKCIPYSNLGNFILEEFTSLTSGILSNFALISLTTLRKNSHKILGLFSKKLDNAFLLHKLLLPNPSDANEQLIQNFSHTIEAMLSYLNDNSPVLSIELLECWLDDIGIDRTKKICKQDIVINTEFLKKWINLGYEKAFLELWEEKGYDIKLLEKLDNSLSEFAKLEGVKFFKDDNDSDEDAEFSILTLHKSNVKNRSSIPKLSLGSIVKHDLNDEKVEYFLCIQAKCDSVRVGENRRFIFIELEPVDTGKKFNLVVKDINSNVIKFKYKNKSYDLKTYKFTATADKHTVLAQQEEDYNYFETIHNEKLIWLCDLKDMQAQRISNIIAGQISRVGLDEYEWLRRFAP